MSEQYQLTLGLETHVMATQQGILDPQHVKMSISAWRAGMAHLRLINNLYDVVLADMIGIGERTFGAAKVEEELKQLEFPYGDVTHARQILAIPADLRQRYRLRGEHFAAMEQGVREAKIETDEDKREFITKWAELAVEHSLTPNELKKSIALGKLVTSQKQRELMGRDTGLRTIQGLMIGFRQWRRQVGQMESWPVERLLQIKEECAEIYEFTQLLDQRIAEETAKPVTEKTVAPKKAKA